MRKLKVLIRTGFFPARTLLHGLAVAVVLLSVPGPVFSQVIRLGSLAPAGSPWGIELNRLAAEWARLSNGRVQLQVFHGGVAGDEADVLRKIRVGQLQAAVLTSMGLNLISPEAMTLSAPLLIRTDEELSHVVATMRPDLNDALRDQGFSAIAWTNAGWLRFFSKTPIRTPEDVKRLRLAASGNEEELFTAFQLMGYRPTPVSTTELLTSLNSGLVDTFYGSPIAAAGFQWFGVAPHMLELRLAPFVGSLVIDNRVWSRISDDLKPQLIAAAERMEQSLNDTVVRLEAEAIETMARFGLSTITLTDSERRRWVEEFEAGLNVTVGTVFPADVVQRVSEILEEYRRNR